MIYTDDFLRHLDRAESWTFPIFNSTQELRLWAQVHNHKLAKPILTYLDEEHRVPYVVYTVPFSTLVMVRGFAAAWDAEGQLSLQRAVTQQARTLHGEAVGLEVEYIERELAQACGHRMVLVERVDLPSWDKKPKAFDGFTPQEWLDRTKTIPEAV